MGMFKSNETLTDAELDEISGGENVGGGIFSAAVGGFTFEYNSNTGRTYIGAGSTILECNANGRCRP
jgi:bacteriocin-like protein